jgi:hypothetical protein
MSAESTVISPRVYIYRMSGECQHFRTLLLRLYPVRNVIHWSGSQRLRGYGNLRWFEPSTEHQGHSCVLQHRNFDDAVPLFCLFCAHTPCFSCSLIHGNLEVRSGDRGGQFCWPPRPIHLSGNYSFRYSVTCRLRCGGPRHAESTSEVCFVPFKSSLTFWSRRLSK